VPGHIEVRIAELRRLIAEREGHASRISQYLTPTELFMLEHGTDRLRADLAWHERLLERLPELLADELDRKEP
jgi:hypothetical protein